MPIRQIALEIFDDLKSHLSKSSFIFEKNERLPDEDAIILKDKTLLLRTVSKLLQPYPFIMDICGVDYPERERRFELVYYFAQPKGRKGFV